MAIGQTMMRFLEPTIVVLLSTAMGCANRPLSWPWSDPDLNPVDLGPVDENPPPAVAFGPPTTYMFENQTGQLLVGDFDRDGIDDLVRLSDRSYIQSTIDVLFGDRTHPFARRNSVSMPGSQISSIPGGTVGDLNSDGILDLIVTNSSTIFVLLGHGDGTFAPATIPPFSVDNLPKQAAIGDFNADGMADVLVVGRFYGPSIVVLLGTGDGGFSSAKETFQADPAMLAGVSDFNRDGRLDFFGSVGQSWSAVFLGEGDGTFKTQFSDSIYDDLYMPHYVVDIDADGITDIVAAVNSGSGLYEHEHQIAIRKGRGDGTFDPPLWFSAGGDPLHLVFADFDRDGFLDIAASNFGNDIDIVRSTPHGGFVPSTAIYGNSQNISDMVSGDFNGDGRPDLVYGVTSSLVLHINTSP